jgi:hypothetical protein
MLPSTVTRPDEYRVNYSTVLCARLRQISPFSVEKLVQNSNFSLKIELDTGLNLSFPAQCRTVGIRSAAEGRSRVLDVLRD